MLFRLICDALAFFAVYVVYMNVTHNIYNWTLEFDIDGNMLPFFFVLAMVNKGIQQSRENAQKHKVNNVHVDQ